MVRRKVTLSGSYGADPGADMPRVIDLAAAGSLDPGRVITDRFRLEEAGAAYQALAEKSITGRGLVVVEPETDS